MLITKQKYVITQKLNLILSSLNLVEHDIYRKIFLTNYSETLLGPYNEISESNTTTLKEHFIF